MAIRRKLLLGFAFCTLTCLVVASYGPVWLKRPGSTFGLWKYCSRSTGICPEYSSSDLNTKHRVVQAFTVIATLLSFFGTLAAFLSYKTEKTNGVMASLLLLATLIFIAIALGIYTDEHLSDVKDISGVSFGWSYILAWVGAGLALIGIILGFLTLLQLGY